MRPFLFLLLVSTSVLSGAEGPSGDAPRAVELAKKAKPSVVAIEPSGRDGETSGVGTGFIISEDGLIATNLHVIGEARPVRVEMPDGRRLEVTAIHAWDRAKDLAVLQVDAKGLPALPLAPADSLSPGDYVAAMGNPLGFRHSVVEGVVSAIQDIDGQKLVQVAMPVEHGNSGGPLLDREGRVAGLVAMKSIHAERVGFAVPVGDLHALLEKAAPVAIKNWITIGALNAKLWKTTGGLWTQRAGTIRFRGPAGPGFASRALCIHQSEPPSLPYEVSVRVKLDDEAGAAGLLFCAGGADTHYGFYPTAGGLRLTRFEGPDVSSWTILENTRSPVYRPGEWNDLRVRVEKDRLECFVNGTSVITSQDTVLRTGLAGLCKFRGTQPEFKRFRVTPGISSSDPSAGAAGELLAAAARGETLSPDAVETLSAHPEATLEAAEKEAAALENRAAALRRQAAAAHSLAIARQLKDLLTAQEPPPSGLIRAAFLLSRLDNPEFEPAEGMAEVDRLSAELKASLTEDDRSTPEKTLASLHRWMFQENGFHGAEDDMNHRANSYLNEVIDDREGMPVTLCLLHQEFARRIGLEVTLRNFPGRVMNHLQLPGDPPRDVYIDAFQKGRLLTEAEVTVELLSGSLPSASEDVWKPAQDRDVILRMLNNLTANAAAAEDETRLLRYLDTTLVIDPQAAFPRLQRLLLHAKNGRNDDARADAVRLIADEPEGIDTERVLELMKSLK